MLVHTYYSHLGTKQYLKFRFTFKLPSNSVNTSNSGNTFEPKFNLHLNIDRTGVILPISSDVAFRLKMKF
jgi:hypothetical protein